MSWLSGLLGGGGNPVTTTTSQTELSPQVQQLLASLNLNQQSAPTLYQGQTIAGFDPNELTAQQSALQAGQAGGQLATQANATQAQMLDPSFQLDVANNPYLQAANQVTTQDVTRNLNENILKGIRGEDQVAGSVFSGGTSKGGIAAGLAAGRASGGIADAITKAQYDAYNKGIGNLQTAIGQNAGVQAGNLFAPTVQGGVGAQNRAMEQAQLDEQQKNHYLLPLLNQEWVNNQLGVAQTLNGMTGRTVNTQTGATPGGPSRIGGAMSGALAGSALGPWGTAGGALLGFLSGRS